MPKSRFSIILPIVLLLGDLLLLNLAFFGMLWGYEYLGFNDIKANVTTLQLSVNLLWVVAYFLNNMYQIERGLKFSVHVQRSLQTLVIHLFLIFTAWISFRNNYPREFFGIFYGVFSIGHIGWRLLSVLILRAYRKKGFNYRYLAIFGDFDKVNDLKSYFEQNTWLGYQVRETIIFQNPSDLSINEDLEDRLRTRDIDIIFYASDIINQRFLRDLIGFAEGNLMKVRVQADFLDSNSSGIRLIDHGSRPTITINSSPLDLAFNIYMKRIFDVTFSLSVIVLVMSWLYPLIALLIKLSSKGPVLFKQLRTGKDNKSFYCFKFRSMKMNSQSDSKQATKNDSRITWIGAIIRKTSIDELPQFFNVLLGDMSVVGPRPHMLSHTEEYSYKVQKFMSRHFVKPGITGLAQAKGFRGETNELYEMQGRVKLDRFYVKNWSLLLDLKIIFLTLISIVFKNDKAY